MRRVIQRDEDAGPAPCQAGAGPWQGQLMPTSCVTRHQSRHRMIADSSLWSHSCRHYSTSRRRHQL